MSKKRHLHPLSGSSLGNLACLLRRRGRDVDLRYSGRLLTIASLAALGAPLALLERTLYGRRIRRQPLDKPPVMIVGHWRSGTTNLHNLLLQDPQFASVSLLHCVIPHLHLTAGRLIGAAVQWTLPRSRPMDAVPLSIREPMSEDFGLVGMSNQTHYGSYFFPRQAEEEFRRTVLFEGPEQGREIRLWERDYARLLRKVTFAGGGRRLCLKNPPNTARVRHILRLLPETRFVLVRRNPWVVHASTCRLMERFFERFALQTWDQSRIEQFVSTRYQLLMDRWFADRSEIREDQLLELAHEQIVCEPLAAVERVYAGFGIDGFQALQPALTAYVRGLSDYRNNQYRFDPDYIDRITPYVERTAREWGYTAPGEADSTSDPR